jgi:uncharacterized protein YbcV (DUF1398 family)
MKYDPIMCMMVDGSVKTKDAEYKMKVTSYVINKGQSGEYYGLKNKETNQVLYSAPNNWKSREGAKRWAEKKGMIYVEDSNTLDKAIKSCDIPNIKESLKQDIKSGKITIKQAGEEMYEAGMFNWIPDENEVKRKLGL